MSVDDGIINMLCLTFLPHRNTFLFANSASNVVVADAVSVFATNHLYPKKLGFFSLLQ